MYMCHCGGVMTLFVWSGLHVAAEISVPRNHRHIVSEGPMPESPVVLLLMEEGDVSHEGNFAMK